MIIFHKSWAILSVNSLVARDRTVPRVPYNYLLIHEMSIVNDVVGLWVVITAWALESVLETRY
jgi:hypothetical protein